MSRVADAYAFPHEEVLSRLTGRALTCVRSAYPGNRMVSQFCEIKNEREDVVEKLSEMLSLMPGDETVAEAAARVGADSEGRLRRNFLDAVRLLREADVEVAPEVDMGVDEISRRVHRRRFHDLLLQQIEMLSPDAIQAAVFARL